MAEENEREQQIVNMGSMNRQEYKRQIRLVKRRHQTSNSSLTFNHILQLPISDNHSNTGWSLIRPLKKVNTMNSVKFPTSLTTYQK